MSSIYLHIHIFYRLHVSSQTRGWSSRLQPNKIVEDGVIFVVSAKPPAAARALIFCDNSPLDTYNPHRHKTTTTSKMKAYWFDNLPVRTPQKAPNTPTLPSSQTNPPH